MIRTILRVAAPVLVIGGAIAGLFVLNAAGPEPEKKQEAARPISLFVETPTRETITLSVITQGEVRPRREIDLVAQVSGRVITVADHFVPGGFVSPDDVLVKVEDTDYRLDMVRARARLAEARLELDQRKADGDIAKRQWEEWLADKPSPLALRQPQIARAQAQYNAAEADLEDARLDVRRTLIKTPFEGRIRETMVDIGQFVVVGTQLARVFSTDRVQVRLPLTDEQFAQLNLPIAYSSADGADFPVKLSAVVAGQTRSWTGRIVRTDASIDPQTRLVHAFAEVIDPYGEGADNGVPLAVGLFVTAEIAGEQIVDATMIPSAALRNGNTVYVVDETSTLHRREVGVRAYIDDRVVVDTTFASDETVVVSPLGAAREGMTVEAVPIERRAQLAKLATQG
ncbi:MAG: efflux RND transporter periplasmic adaptor subunit [Pseudomonadota bacterium]